MSSKLELRASLRLDLWSNYTSTFYGIKLKIYFEDHTLPRQLSSQVLLLTQTKKTHCQKERKEIEEIEEIELIEMGLFDIRGCHLI